MDWILKIPTFSIHPDSASRDDVVRMATEIMEARRLLYILLVHPMSDRLVEEIHSLLGIK